MMGFCELIEKRERSVHDKLTKIYSIFDKYFHSGLVKKGAANDYRPQPTGSTVSSGTRVP